MPAGRPIKYTPLMLQKKFADYIKDCTHNGLFANITGFCLFIDMNVDTYYEYNKREEFTESIKKIDEMLLNVTVQKACEARNPAFLIFYMKNKFKWTDRQEVISDNINHNLNEDVKSLSVEELKAEIEALK